MARTMHEFHPKLKRGDAFLHNSPYHGCSHAADHTILAPVIDASGRHQFTVLVKAHQADIGNSAPTTYFADARDIYAEGALIFPAVKIQSEYETNADIIRMCRARIRVPNQWHGDFLAMIGAARTGERELLRLGEEVGFEVLAAFGRQWLAHAERLATAAIKAFPAGRAKASSCHDPVPAIAPDGVTVNAAVEIDPDAGRIVVDLRDNVDVLPCGLNVSLACARTAALIGVFNSMGPDIPKNRGSISRIEILIREGSAIGGGTHPASFSVSTTNLADRVAAAVQLAMGILRPSSAIAEVGAVNPPHKGVVSGFDPRSGKRYINQLFLGNTGGPASAWGDAWLTYSHAGNAGLCFIDSVEMTELHHPLRVDRRALKIDSEGAGRHCGAPCLEVELGPTIGELELSYVSDGVINAAQGVFGGRPGGRASQQKRSTGGGTEPLAPIARITLRAGKSVVSVCTGGGGCGDPKARDPEQVRNDVLERLIGRERARTIYGVQLDAANSVDAAATAALRRQAPCN